MEKKGQNHLYFLVWYSRTLYNRRLTVILSILCNGSGKILVKLNEDFIQYIKKAKVGLFNCNFSMCYMCLYLKEIVNFRRGIKYSLNSSFIISSSYS